MSQTDTATERRGLWVYAICERVDETSLRSLTGVAGTPVTTVTSAGLTAVAEDVDLAEFGEQALRANLEDMAWLDATARAHHAVIDALAGQTPPVMPMRLATVYSSEAGLKAMLGARSAEILDVLGRISERSEWGVKAFAPVGASHDAGAGAPSADRGAGSGAAYLRRRRDELSARRQGHRQALADAERVHDGLSAIAIASRLHAPQAPQLTGTQEPMLLNAAYLMDEPQGDAVRQAVASLAEECPAVRLELSGPWPPYSFAELGGRSDDDR